MFIVVAGAGVIGLVLYRWQAGRNASTALRAVEIPEYLAAYEGRFEQEFARQRSGVSGPGRRSNGDEEDEVSDITRSGEKGRSSAPGAKAKGALSAERGQRGEQHARPRPKRSVPGAESKARGRGTRRRAWLIGVVLVAGVALLFAVISLSSPVQRDAQAQAALPIAALGTEDVHALAISPRDVNVVFFGHHNGIMRSDDGGRTWRAFVARRSFDAMGLAISPSVPSVLYTAGHGVFARSTDGGNNWQAVANDLPHDDIHGLAVDPEDANTLYAYVAGYGLFKSDDGGAKWKNVSVNLPKSVVALAAANDRRTLYAGTVDAGLLISGDDGATWRRVGNGLDTRTVLSLATSPAASGLVYAGTDKALFKSTDGGESWLPTAFRGAASAVAVAPGDARLILVVDDKTNVYRSDDGGATWGRGQ